MEAPINNVLDYAPPPSEKEYRRRRAILWLSAAVSLGMAVGGYLFMAYLVLR